MKTTWYSLYLFCHITLLSVLLCTYSLPHVFGIKVRFGWIVLCGICISFFIVHQSFSFWQTVTTKSNGFYFWFYRSGRKHKTIPKTLTSWNKDDTLKTKLLMKFCDILEVLTLTCHFLFWQIHPCFQSAIYLCAWAVCEFSLDDWMLDALWYTLEIK